MSLPRNPTRAIRIGRTHIGGGHPIAVGRACWAAMEQAGALPEGARSVLRGLGPAVVRVAVDDAAIRADVDDPDDLAALRGGAR